ncbi:hypothetical protein MNBD_ALPHA11-1767 [hydrothermal vent metagenome]|uniref:Uncharacterized protein n=1 Tax=hydrothermal vent metagenome TaxID=652676 RepID=A0A3B0U0X7_9ZZZZ
MNYQFCRAENCVGFSPKPKRLLVLLDRIWLTHVSSMAP